MDDWAKLRDAINALTADDLVRVAKTYLDPSKALLVVLGDALTLGGQLEALGLGKVDPPCSAPRRSSTVPRRSGGILAPMRLIAWKLAIPALALLLNGCVGDTAPGPDGGLPDATDAPSTPNKSLGALCSVGGECASGFCADGVCCDRACNGQCEACSVGNSKGTCTTVSGTPIAPRAACKGTGTCAGTCDGKSANCSYPAAGTICGGSCSGTCDGAGTCSDTGTGACPNGFACGNSGKCLTTCAGNTDCQPFFSCDTPSGTCKRVPESDCLDGKDNNGDGLADCADPTCLNVSVECVPSVGAGAAIGTVVNSLPCPVNFGSPQNLYAGLDQSGSCTGCTCATSCYAYTTLYSGANCTGGTSLVYNYGATSGQTTSCNNITDYSAASMKVTSIGNYSCVGAGTGTPPPVSWSTSKVFCAASTTSSTCGQNQICVSKPSTGLAARVASSGSCPSGYSGTKSSYYTGATPGSCSSCSSCTASSTPYCSGISFAFIGNQACTAGTPDEFVGGNVSNNPVGSCDDFGLSETVTSVNFSNLSGIGHTDNCKSNVATTQPQPSGGQYVCALP